MEADEQSRHEAYAAVIVIFMNVTEQGQVIFSMAQEGVRI